MKKIFMLVATTISLFATDYSSMSLEELINAKGTIPTEDQTTFQDAMKSKMQALTPEERAEMNVGRYNNSTSENGSMQRLKDGSGSGGMYKGSRGGGGRR